MYKKNIFLNLEDDRHFKNIEFECLKTAMSQMQVNTETGILI